MFQPLFVTTEYLGKNVTNVKLDAAALDTSMFKNFRLLLNCIYVNEEKIIKDLFQ